MNNRLKKNNASLKYSVLKSIKGENMGKTNLGWLIFAIGLSTLSLEIYFLKIVQLLDQMVTHSWNGYMDYIFVDGAIFLSMCISCGVMLIGLVQIIKGYTHKGTSKNDSDIWFC